LKSQPVEISFSPVDNQRLANLCGALDENLKQIETVLDVTIARRGEHFSLRGKSAQTLLATEALRNFYSQTQHHLSIEQIQLGLIEVMNPHHSVKPGTINVPAKETPIFVLVSAYLEPRAFSGAESP